MTVYDSTNASTFDKDGSSTVPQFPHLDIISCNVKIFLKTTDLFLLLLRRENNNFSVQQAQTSTVLLQSNVPTI